MFFVVNVITKNVFYLLNIVKLSGLAFFIFKSFPLEIPIFLRDHNNGMYNCLTYFLAKIFTDVNYICFTFWTSLKLLI